MRLLRSNRRLHQTVLSSTQEVFIPSRGSGQDKHVYVSIFPVKVKNAPAGGVIAVLKDTIRSGLAYSVAEQKENRSFDEIIGSSKAIRDLKDRAMRVAFGNSTVLITGESGTGKDLLAKAIHSASPRCKGSHLLGCKLQRHSGKASLKSELFGYAPGGAFTGARHEGKQAKLNGRQGNPLLDEIGMPFAPSGQIAQGAARLRHYPPGFNRGKGIRL